MKVIFLDVDGVLSSGGVNGLCEKRLDLFADLVKRSKAEVVLSSTWRRPQCREGRLRLQRELGKRGVEFYGMTPILDREDRFKEIAAWCDGQSESIEAFIALDDDPDGALTLLGPNLVTCDGYAGLTEDLVGKAVTLLGAASNAPGTPNHQE